MPNRVFLFLVQQILRAVPARFTFTNTVTTIDPRNGTSVVTETSLTVETNPNEVVPVGVPLKCPFCRKAIKTDLMSFLVKIGHVRKERSGDKIPGMIEITANGLRYAVVCGRPSCTGFRKTVFTTLVVPGRPLVIQDITSARQSFSNLSIGGIPIGTS